MSGARRPEDGIVLVNVLVVLAIASAVVALMLGMQDRAVDRARLAGNMAQARELALAGEASVRVALRRDMDEAPEVDHMGEAWAAAVQEEVVLDTGRFSVAVADVNARYDLNRLAAGRIADVRAFARIAAAAGLDDAAAARIAAGLARRGAVDGPSDLAGFGLPPQAIAAIAPHVTALRGTEGQVNLNAAGALVLGALVADAGAAARLIALRAERGSLTAEDLARVGIAMPAGTGFTSDAWEATVVAEVDGAVVELRSRLRRRREDDVARVIVEERRLGPLVEDRPPPPEGLD